MKPSLFPILGMWAYMGRIPLANRPFDKENLTPPKISVFGHGKKRWNVDGIDVIAENKADAQWKAMQMFKKQ